MADAASADVLDVRVVAQLAGLRALAGRDVLGGLIALFVRDVPPRLVACRDAIARAEPDALRRAAHAVRGDAGALGARELAALCARIESEASIGWPGQEQLGELAKLVDELDPAFQRAKRALEAFAVLPGSSAP